MPLYAYRCSKCGKNFEKIQKPSNKPRARCPECGGSGKRLITSAAIRFKGTGWYVTDYADKKTPPGGKDEKEKGSGKDPAGKESKSEKESKPEKESKSEKESKPRKKS